MAPNTDPQLNMDEIRDLLSPYLDGEVSDEERARVEHALRISPAMMDELESLRQTVTWLAELPTAAAPRPFTLTEADLQVSFPELRTKPSRWFSFPPWAAGLAAVVAVMLVVLAAGGVLLSNQSGLAPAEIAMQQESAAPAVEQADTVVSSAAEADRSELEAGEPMAAEVVEQPAEEAPTEAVVEEPVVEQEMEMLPEPAVAPTLGLEKAAPEEERTLAGAAAEEAERPLAVEELEEEEQVEEAAIDDTAEDAAMMAAPAAGEEGGQTVTDSQLEPAVTITPQPAQEAAPLAPQTTREIEAESIELASATPSSDETDVATPAIIDSTSPATVPVRASPAGSATPTVMPIQRTLGSRGISLALGALAVIIIAGGGLWLLSRRIKKR